jgi:hypothetical protein
MKIVALQFAYPLSPETEAGTELWCPVDNMDPVNLRAAVAVLAAEGRHDEAAALRAFGREKFGPVEL